jgi:hypothetical protein
MTTLLIDGEPAGLGATMLTVDGISFDITNLSLQDLINAFGSRQTLWKTLFRYNNGQLFWKVCLQPRQPVGAIAGHVSNLGYTQITVKTKHIFAHRIIWELINGDIATGLEIDHRDGNRLNNYIENLRLATRNDNNRNMGIRRNNTSGYKGVYYFKRDANFQAQISVNDKKKHLGYFETAEEAALAYNKAALLYHGDFANLNVIKEGSQK